MNYSHVKRSVYVVCCAAATVTAAHANLLSNGGFETGDFTDWTVVGGDLGVTNNSNYVHSGNYGLSWGTVGQEGTVSQDITTVVGQTYDLSFWYAIYDGPTNEISAFVDGTQVFDYFDPPLMPWTYESVDFVANSTTTDISFGFRQDPGFSAFDDASVVATNSTPSPAAIVPFVAGFISLARRRKSVR
jgi:hypothetical protein